MKMPLPKKEKFFGPPFAHMSCRMNVHKLIVFKEKAKSKGHSMNKIMENWVDIFIAEDEK